MDKIPLNYEASEGDTHKQLTDALPPEVVQCLENAQFLHLATCADNVPHVSLMNYTYLPSSPYSSRPVIVMTTNPASRKTTNIIANPNVSLLVHDWVSHRPPTHTRRPSGGSPGPEHRSSLASLLLNLNTSAMSSISATIGGVARLAPPSSEEGKFLIEKHLENNTFEDTEPLARQQINAGGNGGTTGHFVTGEEVGVIVVDIKDVRISDWKGTVRDWALISDSNLANGTG
ncbi:pyridoxamine 5'-phosphate oxidase domain-containing protein [Hirsutella rhossiliensis]|uniref:Pyridoxamine 5'-phosphate oxidase domain-containing protein n=1 Tax=Hirsutella rhossiliensis TaxID=111463 RepID=A0A9P8N3C6_9HYPO|nr:pyridoxamine 5'-phosphate oxidase domain-containing protein [Hirsutella rhossiliensis]KAH0963957.1 pyridoxamine 5'-phosphate oxidase domain-containing protein [Hirsutella rhossiliensis]